MGRGLSELQKTMLRLAFRNRVSENRTAESRGSDLYYYEVLAAYWGWDLPEHVQGRDHRHPGEHKFSKAAIGTKAYGTAHAALSRAVIRLQQRGLVDAISGKYSHWSGLNLTTDGITAALELEELERRRRA